MTRLRTLLPIALLLSSACAQSDLDEQTAADVIREHFAAIAPAGLPESSWQELEFEVEGVLDEGDVADHHVVGFRVYDPAEAEEGRGPVYTATLARGDDGTWRVVRYGDTLKPVVAGFVTFDRRRRYAALLDGLTTVQDSAANVFSAWRRGLRGQLESDPEDARFRQIAARLDAGIPAALLQANLTPSMAAFPDTLEWGVQDDNAADGAEYVWVRRRDRPDEACAQWIAPLSPPADLWLEGRFPTCRGRGGRYVERAGHDAVLREIEAGGGLLPHPPSANP